MALPLGQITLPALNQPPIQLPQLSYQLPPAQAQIAGRLPFIQNAALGSVLGPLTQPNYGIPVVNPYGGFGNPPLMGYAPPTPAQPAAPSGGGGSDLSGLVGVGSSLIGGLGGVPPSVPPVIGMPSGTGGPTTQIPRDPGMSSPVTQNGSNLAGLGSGIVGAANIYGGIQQGGQQGAGQALLGAGKLAGALGSSSATAGTALGSALAASGAATALPIAGAAFIANDYLNKAFLGDSSKARNLDAYKQATGATQVTLPMGKFGANYMVVPNTDGSYQLVSNKDFNDLAGSWYGATYAPDGNQGDWQQKYDQFRGGVQAPKLMDGYTFDPTNGKIMYRGRVAGNYGG